MNKFERKVTKIGNSYGITFPQDSLKEAGITYGDNIRRFSTEQTKTNNFRNDAYPSIHEKSAALTESLASNNAFYNANKRTALASLIVFLNLNGYKWIMDVHKEQTLIVDIVNHNIHFQNWLPRLKTIHPRIKLNPRHASVLQI